MVTRATDECSFANTTPESRELHDFFLFRLFLHSPTLSQWLFSLRHISIIILSVIYYLH
jgi:hypothetical protein